MQVELKEVPLLVLALVDLCVWCYLMLLMLKGRYRHPKPTIRRNDPNGPTFI
jgi:hypothetical protein